MIQGDWMGVCYETAATVALAAPVNAWLPLVVAAAAAFLSPFFFFCLADSAGALLRPSRKTPSIGFDLDCFPL